MSCAHRLFSTPGARHRARGEISIGAWFAAENVPPAGRFTSPRREVKLRDVAKEHLDVETFLWPSNPEASIHRFTAALLAGCCRGRRGHRPWLRVLDEMGPQ
jgi:hypothetical protein